MKKGKRRVNNISFKIKTKHSLRDDKISDIRRILNRLRDIISKKYRKGIKKKLYEIENKKNLSEVENDEYLRELERILNNEENYSHDDFDYYGIRDIEIYLMKLMKKNMTNQYYSKVLLRVITNIMKAEELKQKQ